MTLASAVRTAGLAGLAGPALLAALAGAGCAAPRGSQPGYRPRHRAVTITAVPLLTREMQRIYPFLARDFATGGVLEGREVYAFEPSSVTVIAGDTVDLTLVNPEDDEHSLVLPGLAVRMPGQSVVTAQWVAGAAGLVTFTCAVPAHLPYMYGTIVVLPAAGFAAP